MCCSGPYEQCSRHFSLSIYLAASMILALRRDVIKFNLPTQFQVPVDLYITIKHLTDVVIFHFIALGTQYSSICPQTLNHMRGVDPAVPV